jgi:hypothetical protein
MDKVTNEERNALILSQIDELPDHLLNSLYVSALKKAIEEKYGVYIIEPDGRLTVEGNWKMFLESKEYKKCGSIERYKRYREFKFMENQFISLEGLVLKTHALRVNCFVYLMEYVINGIVHEDLRVAHEIIDNINMKIDTESWDYTNFGVYGSTEVKKYKNGKVQFNKLTDAQRERLNEIIQLFRR